MFYKRYRRLPQLLRRRPDALHGTGLATGGILFPAWLVVVFSLGALLAWSLLGLLNDNLAALFAATLLLGYLSYEIFHACEHLPPEHPLSRPPWIRHMRRLHELHHRRELMQTHNFNLVFLLMDCATAPSTGKRNLPRSAP